MGVPLPWFAVAAATTLINGATLGFIGWRERNRALQLWAWAWIAWAAAVAPLTMLDPTSPSAFTVILCGLLWVASTLCFLSGTYAFSQRRLPRAWVVVATGCVLLALGLGIGPVGALGMVPLVLFQSVGLLATGVLIIRSARRRAGGWLSGLALIALALHILDAQILAANPALLPWGFVVAMGLEILTALGMLMLYYEHARAELLETQRALAETRRIEALGRVAGGVAHDFNNMLTVMLGHMELIRLFEDRPERVGESLDVIERAIEQAARLTSQLLAFGRRSVIQVQAIDVREVVEKTLDLLKKVIPENIQLRFRCAEGNYAASMDRALLEQIVLNLVTNARDAISGPGEVVVELELERADEPEPRLLLRVVDDGTGMDEAVLQQVFEPFFTTKGTGRGTGLGLASVQGAVSQLGGHVRVESRPGGGSVFEVSLPLLEARAAQTVGSQTPEIGTLDVLLVDDDEGVRRVTAELLGIGGHRVDQASDGLQALEMIRAKAYDLVLTDVVMPRMGGLALLEQITELRPETLVLFTSGHPPDADLDAAIVNFVPKPFHQNALLGLVARLVAQHRDRQRAELTG